MIPFVWRVRAGIAVALLPPLLEVVSFALVERFLRRTARGGAIGAPDDHVAAQWVQRQLMRLPPPWAHSCLRRATILYYLLRRGGRAVELCIGVRHDAQGALHAHAWLQLDGAIYLESERGSEQVADFRVIARFPNDASLSA